MLVMGGLDCALQDLCCYLPWVFSHQQACLQWSQSVAYPRYLVYQHQQLEDLKSQQSHTQTATVDGNIQTATADGNIHTHTHSSSRWQHSHTYRWQYSHSYSSWQYWHTHVAMAAGLHGNTDTHSYSIVDSNIHTHTHTHTHTHRAMATSKCSFLTILVKLLVPLFTRWCFQWLTAESFQWFHYVNPHQWLAAKLPVVTYSDVQRWCVQLFLRQQLQKSFPSKCSPV